MAISELGVLISLFGVGPGQEIDFHNNHLKKFYEEYKSTHQEIIESYLAAKYKNGDEIERILDNFSSLYKPATYCTFGSFDLATITLIDDFDVFLRLPFLNKPTIHQFIYGSLPTESISLKNDIIKNPHQLYEKLIGIAQFKINSLYNIEYGNHLANPIKELILDHTSWAQCGVRSDNRNKERIHIPEGPNSSRVFIIDSMGWNEITLLIFANNYSDIMQIYADLRKITFQNIENFFPSDIRKKDFSDLLKNEDIHLFSTTNIILGFQYDILANLVDCDFNKDNILSNLNNHKDILDELKGNRVRPFTSIYTKPGHISELTKKIAPHFDSDTEGGKTLKIVFNGWNNTVLEYPCNYYNEGINTCSFPKDIYRPLCNDFCSVINRHDANNNYNFIDLPSFLADLYKLRFDDATRKHMYGTITNVGIEVSFETKNISDIHLTIADDLQSKCGFDHDKIANLLKFLIKCNASDNLITLFSHAFSLFNNMVKDYPCIDSYLELYSFLNGLCDYISWIEAQVNILERDCGGTIKGVINKYNASGADNIRGSGYDLFKDLEMLHKIFPDALECFHKSFTQRFYSGLYTKDITDITMYYKGGSQHILTCMDGFMNSILSFMVSEEKNRFGLTQISCDQGINCTPLIGSVIKMNLSHLYQPEKWSNLYHELGHYILNSDNRFKDIGINLKTKTDIIHKIRHETIYNFRQLAFAINDVFCDLFLCHFGFLDNIELYSKHFWGSFLATPHSEELMISLLYRYCLVMEICYSKDRLFCIDTFLKYKNNSPWNMDISLCNMNNDGKIEAERLKDKMDLFDKLINEQNANPMSILKDANQIIINSHPHINFNQIGNYRIQKSIIKMEGDIKDGNIIYKENADDFGEFVIKLNYAYLKSIYELIKDDEIFLIRDEMNLPSFNENAAPLMIDSLGTLFSADPETRKIYFRMRMTFLRSLWGESQEYKMYNLRSLLSPDQRINN